ncbi:Uncharacterised protein [Staphylococcus aureus]|nr:Uncharacterised protein [Staphylococcus aureus]
MPVPKIPLCSRFPPVNRSPKMRPILFAVEPSGLYIGLPVIKL